MGVGKTTVCQEMKRKLDNAVFLDGDWCWDADPFIVTDETKLMVMDNICYLLNNFIKCSSYENIIFCWVMHEQKIIDDILFRLNTNGCDVKIVSLICNAEELIKRLQNDIDSGIRKPDIIERSIARIPLYDNLKTIKIDTNNKSVNEIVDEIIGM
ncbi:MAG: nucleotide kinase [Ruminococcaceae bacterium]|nr:nucleotide kinase [Oscillospiraceae bacterium]